MDVLVDPGEADAIAERERRIGEGRIANDGGKIARAAAFKSDLIVRALVFDAGHDRAEPR